MRLGLRPAGLMANASPPPPPRPRWCSSGLSRAVYRRQTGPCHPYCRAGAALVSLFAAKAPLRLPQRRPGGGAPATGGNVASAAVFQAIEPLTQHSHASAPISAWGRLRSRRTPIMGHLGHFGGHFPKLFLSEPSHRKKWENGCSSAPSAPNARRLATGGAATEASELPPNTLEMPTGRSRFGAVA